MVRPKLLITAAVIAVAVVAACADTTSPKNVVLGEAVATLEASASSTFPRSGTLHVEKECSQYTGLAGSFCTITSSNIPEIEPGTRVVYASDRAGASLNSDVVLDPPGPGNNVAFGHVVLDLASGQGVVTISGGTGKFTWLNASVVVSRLVRPNWAWDGWYSFSPRD